MLTIIVPEPLDDSDYREIMAEVRRANHNVKAWQELGKELSR